MFLFGVFVARGAIALCVAGCLEVSYEAAVFVDAAAEGGLAGRVALVCAGGGGEVLQGGRHAGDGGGPGGAAGEAEPDSGEGLRGGVAVVARAPEQVGEDEGGEEDEGGRVGQHALVAHHGEQEVAERVGEHDEAEGRGG